MKKIFTLIAIATLLLSCSNDDGTPSKSPEEILPPRTAFRMYIPGANIQLPEGIKTLTFKTKTANGQWTERYLENWYMKIHNGDSIHISTNGKYIPNKENRVGILVHTDVEREIVNYSDSLFFKEYSVYNQPIDLKIKMEIAGYK